ncbi:MAG: sigma-70 family RNA polymerase sigma factor [Thermoleophilaceae bacterium]
MHPIRPSHLRAVKSLASKAPARSSMDREELVGYGLLGLASAARRFDGSQGVKFETFAHYRVSGAILDGLRALDPLSRRDRRRVKADGDVPAVAALRQRAQVTPLPWEHEDQHGRSEGEAGLTLAEVVADPNSPDPAEEAERAELQEQVAEALTRLTWRERRLIHLRFECGLNLAEVGEELGVSESRVSQLQRSTLESLAELLRDDGCDALAA